MRKILIMVMIVLMLVFGYNALVNGIKIGSLQISSIKQIDEGSKDLDKRTEEVNSLIDVEYPKTISSLKEASKKMQDAKEKYLNETNMSSDADIKRALQIESFDIERLFAKIGNHADNEGVNLKFVVNSSASGSSETKDLAFTVNGSYIAITNFIYALEDDNELNFRIYDFKEVGYNGDILQATFTVKDVRITSTSLNEALTSSSSSSTTTDTTNTGNTQNTNSTTTNTVVE